MSFALVIDPNAQIFDGTTFVPPDQWDYQRQANNHFVAVNKSGGPVGTIDPMAMLQAIEDDAGALFDRAAVEAGSPIKITDLLLERALVFRSTSGSAFQLGTQSPAFPGQPFGVRLFLTPTPNPTQTANWFQFGGSGQLSEDLNLGPGGCVTLPTGMRLFFFSDDEDPVTNQLVALWLVPFKSPKVFAQSCCCATPPPEAQV